MTDIRQQIKDRLKELGKSSYWLGMQAQDIGICTNSMTAKFLAGQNMEFSRVICLAELVGLIVKVE